MTKKELFAEADEIAQNINESINFLPGCSQTDDDSCLSADGYAILIAGLLITDALKNLKPILSS